MANENESAVPAQNLRVPQRDAGMLTSVKNIMEAYKTQSKIQLYDDASALSNDDISGVGGRNDIPMSALRPREVVTDENGNRVVLPKGQVMRETSSIANAYRKMKGQRVPEEEETIDTEPSAMSSIPRFKADYVEDMPDDEEGLLDILALAIRNARANLEMLESLYAALSPQEYTEE